MTCHVRAEGRVRTGVWPGDSPVESAMEWRQSIQSNRFVNRVNEQTYRTGYGIDRQGSPSPETTNDFSLTKIIQGGPKLRFQA